jgi:DNA polymerase
LSIFQRELALQEAFASALKRQGFSDERIAIELSNIYLEVRGADTLDITEVEDLINHCRDCYGQELVMENFVPVPGRGKPNPDIVFVGIMPGNTEQETGKVFSGPNSKILRDAMSAVGIGSNDCPIYATNLVCCSPLKGEPRVKQVTNCSPYLSQALWVLQPNIIVTLGTKALSYFLGKSVKISEYEGEVLLQGRFILVPLKHPSALHRITNPKEREAAFKTYKEQIAGVKRMNDRMKKLREEGKIMEKGDAGVSFFKEVTSGESPPENQQLLC